MCVLDPFQCLIRVFLQDLTQKTKVEKAVLEQKAGQMHQELQVVKSMCQAQEKELERYKQHISIQEFMKDVENVRTVPLSLSLYLSIYLCKCHLHGHCGKPPLCNGFVLYRP
jgi:hypothetical protein